ncbi:ROK family transcriptional regulator [Paralimibaculum aggregatum]|uniref:ROK family transcriptional regulator n=1 Tax=Paralimibaculum aggregatum TaxID=3036245 RepID=A0ABQ6LH52_9RHOB|nr:ROK family protein [Limibaculum sp. NKW23]GMG82621.1 ROK family transcriptional regulator [Limibaculum sp. NKW23]
MRGGNTVGLRAYNERLVIDAILRAGPLSKAEIARATGLSGQAAKVIVTSLLDDGLLLQGEKIRGQVGQPSTPNMINPRGAFSIGVKIGRSSTDAILVDFTGAVVARRQKPHAAPIPDEALETACRYVEALAAELGEAERARICGVGLAMPSDIELWSDELGVAPERLEGWGTLDPAAVIGARSALSTVVLNDATAACAAEMMLGDGITRSSALYLYLGAFIGAGIVIDGRLYQGAAGNAGAIASMPTCTAAASGRPAQLVGTASVIALERALSDAGIRFETVFDAEPTPEAEAVYRAWRDENIDGIARAIVSALAILDFETVVIDGVLPPQWRRDIVRQVRTALTRFDLRGIVVPQLVTGSVGPPARVLGAALMPLRVRFSPDPKLLVAGRKPAAAGA